MAFLKRPKKARDPFKEIQGCLQKRDYKGALGGFKALLDKDAKNTQIRLRFADTLVLAGSKKEAIRQYRTVADELAEAGFMIRAIAINKKIVQLDPTQSDVHEKLASMNEARSRTTPRSALPLHVSSPAVEEDVQVAGPPVPPEKPIEVEEPPPVEEVPESEDIPSSRVSDRGGVKEPTLSLEESMAMEFGETARPEVSVPTGDLETKEPVEAGEDVVELDMGAVDLAEPTPAEPIGFELTDEGEQPFPTEDAIDAGEETPSLEISFEEGVSEVETEPPTFDVSDEEPTFEEEPVSLDGGDTHEEEAELDLSLDEEAEDVEEAEEISLVEEEPAAPIELTSEAEEMELEIVADEEGPIESMKDEEEEEEEIEVEIETEPSMAADGDSPLVGLLGDDIDSLIDSIIFDVESSVSMPVAPPPPAPTRIPLFSDLNAEEFVDVAIMLVRRSEKPGNVIVKEGDPGDSMFIVSTGEAEATREVDGQQRQLATFSDGDFFGEMAVLSGEPRTATVIARKNTELLELSRADLQQICSRHPEVEAKLRLAYDERRANR
jgi:hypothetical protein